MNVSSVKNLNGETFSAVQDADLTTVVQTNSGNWQDITAYQNASAGYLTAINIPESADWNDTTDVVQANSSTWGQGGTSTSGLVSGTNFVKVPDYEGSTDGEYWSACISGDVQVAHGYYMDETDFHGSDVFSLSAIGSDIGNKLNKNTIENSKTIRSISNNPYEVFDVAYKRTNFTNGSARDLRLDDDADIYYNSEAVVENSYLYSASITAETTATGSIESNEGVWKLVDFSNGSAVLTGLYPIGIDIDYIGLYTWDGWGPITNCEATCTVYTSAELSPLAFKDDIPQINFVSTSSEATGTNILYVVTGTGGN